MVVTNCGNIKEEWKFKIYVHFIKLNATTKKDPFPLPFTDEVLNTMVRCKANSFLDGYYGYQNISIAPKERFKTTFVTN
jgi:hypothetical protein